MRPDYEKLLSYLKSPQVPAELQDKIVSRIGVLSKLRVLKWKVVIFSLTSLASAVAAVFAFQIFKTGLSETGFLQFFPCFFLITRF